MGDATIILPYTIFSYFSITIEICSPECCFQLSYFLLASEIESSNTPQHIVTTYLPFCLASTTIAAMAGIDTLTTLVMLSMWRLPHCHGIIYNRQDLEK